MLTLLERITGNGSRALLIERWSPIAVLLIAAFLRLYNLNYPNSLVFDETYYVKDAYSLLNSGFEKDWSSDADASFAAGDPTGLLNSPSFVVHPPLGKWLIGLGMLVFGTGNPFGWRIVVALLGIATVWLTMKSAKIIFRSALWATVAGLLVAIDGVGIVLSRTALLDQILGFFVILGFYFLLRDKASGVNNNWNRPWLIAMGIALGAATAVKWSGLYFVAVFGLYVVISEAHRNYSIQKSIEKQIDGPLSRKLWIEPSIFSAFKNAVLILIPTLTVYLVSWSGWLFGKGGWSRTWADEPGNALTGFFSWVPTSLQSLWHYHVEIYGFHANLHTAHSYAANPISWPFMLRPTSFFWEERATGCVADTPSQDCVSAITALGNPFIWWAAILATSVLIAAWFRTRDKITTLISIGILAGYVPWLLLMNRTVFEFYVVSFLPWVVLLLVAGLQSWFRNSTNPKHAANWIAGYLALAVLCSVFFYPIWSGMWISYDFWRMHMWLPSWI